MLESRELQIRHVSSDDQLCYLFLFTKNRKSRTTALAYKKELERFRTIVAKPIPEITVLDLFQYQEAMDSMVLAPATLAKAISAVRSLFKFAQAVGYIQLNPSIVMVQPTIEVTTGHRFLTEKQVADLLDAASGDLRSYLMIALGLRTGLRLGEITRIRWSDFHVDPAGRRSVRVVGKRHRTCESKIGEDLWRRVQEYRDSLSGEALEDAHVFAGRGSLPISTTTAWRLMKTAAAKAGIHDFVPHTLRHCFATYSLLNGATILQVKEALSHRDVRVTLRYDRTANFLKSSAADHVPFKV